MSEKKKSSYISAKESRRITRFNRRVTKKLEADRANANKDPKLYTTKMRDENNVVEFDNVCTYFFTDVGTVKAVDGVSFDIPKCSTVGVVGEYVGKTYLESKHRPRYIISERTEKFQDQQNEDTEYDR